MKKNILLTCIGFATPLLAFAPFATSCSQSVTEHFSSVGKTATTKAGEKTATFSLTLKEAITGDITVSAKTTAGTSVSVTSPATVSGTSVKVTVSINVTDLTKSASSTFDLTFSCSSWTSSETITGFTINFTKMEYIDVPESNYVVDGSGKLTSVNIPTGSTRLKIPNSVKSVDSTVLKGKFTLASNAANSITAIVIPSSLLTIPDEAISNNTAINSIDISAFSAIPAGWGNNIFKNASSSGTINVGSMAKEATNSWIMYNSGLKHQWISDTNWKCERYINDRAFSLMASGYFYRQDQPSIGGYGMCWGTGWIIGDATPNNTSDYTYWIGTNWHVKAGALASHMDYTVQEGGGTVTYKYQSGSYRLFYGDKSTQKTINNETGLHYDSNTESGDTNPCYTCFNKDENDGIWEADSKFRLGTQSVLGYNDAIDFTVCKVDFSNVITQGASMPTTIKAKLDNINSWNQLYGCINKVATMSSAKSKAKYVGGFPVDRYTDSVAKWENHAIAASAMTQYAAYHTDRQGYLDMAHTVNDYIDGNDLDISAQYQFNNPVIETWMDGGASGSPLITTDLEICGIYWGGQGTDENEEENFIPMFSILNDTSYKDFITGYLEAK